VTDEKVELGELLTVVDSLRVFPSGLQTNQLWLLKGEHLLVIATRTTKARGHGTRGTRHLWYVMLSSRYGIVESGEAIPFGFREHVERHV
jgi:hypothetical protein